jgi:FAD/FMN-containing dehydrogenase
MDIVAEIAAALGPRAMLVGDDIGPRYWHDLVGRPGEKPLAVIRPRDTAEVAATLRLCHAAGVAVIPQGGLTGLVAATLPARDQIVLSTERMTDIEEVDVDGGTVIVQAGAVLQVVQERVEAAGLSFPLDLGGRGSCTIGGNISTNAGGNRVIRYGMMRDLVLGIEAVTADGTVIAGLRKYIKNNTGIDLKQLFIGSEGTLGIVTRAVLRLFPQPAERAVAACALDGFAQVKAFLGAMRRRLGGDLTAFEVMWSPYYIRATQHVPGVVAPLPPGHPFYAIVECAGVDGERTRELFEAALGDSLAAGHLANAVIAKSEAEAAAVWRLRDAAIEVAMTILPVTGYDVSLPIEHMERFAEEVERVVRLIDPAAFALVFGHLGDGNLHLAVHHSGTIEGGELAIDKAVYDATGAVGGSISAEHGIGLLKRPYLDRSRTPAEIALMRTLKAAMDPKNILNPGRIIAI